MSDIPKLNPGTPKYVDGKVIFEGASDLVEQRNAALQAMFKLDEKIKQSPAIVTALEKLEGPQSLEEKLNGILGRGKGRPDKTGIEQLIQTHAPEELAALTQASDRFQAATKELQTAQEHILKTLDWKTLPGYTPEAAGKAPAPAEAKITPGKPSWNGNNIIFTGASYPDQSAFNTALKKLEAKITPEIDAELKKAGIDTRAGSIVITNNKKAAEILTKHAPQECAALEKAVTDMNNAAHELLKAQHEIVKGLTTLEGASEQQLKAAKAEINRKVKITNRLFKPTLLNTHYANLIELGPLEAIKANSSGEYIRNNKGVFAMKAGGIVVGLGAVIDAAFRGTKKDADGKEIDRSWVARAGEGVIGAALAAGSALHGGR